MPEPITDRDSAVPAFAGWTARASKPESGDDLRLKPTRIASLREFEANFGEPFAEALHVDLTANLRTTLTTAASSSRQALL